MPGKLKSPQLKVPSGGNFSFPGMAACKVEVPPFQAQVWGVYAGPNQLYIYWYVEDHTGVPVEEFVPVVVSEVAQHPAAETPPLEESSHYLVFAVSGLH